MKDFLLLMQVENSSTHLVLFLSTFVFRQIVCHNKTCGMNYDIRRI